MTAATDAAAAFPIGADLATCRFCYGNGWIWTVGKDAYKRQCCKGCYGTGFVITPAGRAALKEAGA